MTSRIHLLGALALVALASMSTRADDRTWAIAAVAPMWTKTAEFYRRGLAENGIVGSSLFFVKDGALAARAVDGWQDRAAKTPVDEHTIYHWASITKTFTGIAIMQLRDRGLLQLDDPIVKYLPDLRRVHNPFGDMSAITLRHLMSHSAGFRDPTWTWGGDKPWHPFEPPSWEQLHAMLPYTEVVFKPGSRFGYSNPGVIYLGRVIEMLSGDDYEVYVAKNILMPLEMHRSFFDRAPRHLLKYRSHSYFVSDAGEREAPFDFDTGITVSNGGLNAPLTDMITYLDFIIGSPERAATYDGILKRSSLEEMFTPQIATDQPGVSVGLSFFVEKHSASPGGAGPGGARSGGNVDLIGHSGDQNGFLSHFYVHLPSRSGYIVAYNTDAQAKAGGVKNTRAMDLRLRDYFVQHVFR